MPVHEMAARALDTLITTITDDNLPSPSTRRESDRQVVAIGCVSSLILPHWC